jgi:TonB family protein
MTYRRALTLLLASCCIAGCAQQTSHAPPAGSANLRTPPPEPMSRAKLAPPVSGRELTIVAPDSALPKIGDYVYVEELPEALTRVPPVYPVEARRTGIEGTVMVQCLALSDGTVGDVRIVKSIPGLDEAAAACVRQWRFKPAMAKGQPITVWVAVPVKFTLR